MNKYPEIAVWLFNYFQNRPSGKAHISEQVLFPACGKVWQLENVRIKRHT